MTLCQGEKLGFFINGPNYIDMKTNILPCVYYHGDLKLQVTGCFVALSPKAQQTTFDRGSLPDHHGLLFQWGSIRLRILYS